MGVGEEGGREGVGEREGIGGEGNQYASAGMQYVSTNLDVLLSYVKVINLFLILLYMGSGAVWLRRSGCR